MSLVVPKCYEINASIYKVTVYKKAYLNAIILCQSIYRINLHIFSVLNTLIKKITSFCFEQTHHIKLNWLFMKTEQKLMVLFTSSLHNFTFMSS